MGAARAGQLRRRDVLPAPGGSSARRAGGRLGEIVAAEGQRVLGWGQVPVVAEPQLFAEVGQLRSRATACGRASAIASPHLGRCSRAAGEVDDQRRAADPGDARARASSCGVCAREAARIASAIPGASRSITARVASGVTSSRREAGAAARQHQRAAALRRSSGAAAASIRARSSATISRAGDLGAEPLRRSSAEPSPLSSSPLAARPWRC